MLSRLSSGAASRWATFPLRLVIGAVFLAHGGQKLFVFGFGGFAGYLSSIGIPAAGFWSVVVILLELLGGIALLVGMLTRYAAAVLSAEMLVAVLAVHARAGFFLPAGAEFALVILAGSLTLLLAGAGPLSLDRRLGLEKGV
ncbi:MAG: DoxX family protein [Candidatus Tectomicrobia bacterium]|nr:DoxX family protein [Candidatus Tectomicrobia bacterium]